VDCFVILLNNEKKASIKKIVKNKQLKGSYCREWLPKLCWRIPEPRYSYVVRSGNLSWEDYVLSRTQSVHSFVMICLDLFKKALTKSFMSMFFFHLNKFSFAKACVVKSSFFPISNRKGLFYHSQLPSVVLCFSFFPLSQQNIAL
jgi:hypothetical protein